MLYLKTRHLCNLIVDILPRSSVNMVNGLSPELGSDEYESEKEATEALLSAHLKIVSILKEKKECISTYSKDTVLANVSY